MSAESCRRTLLRSLTLVSLGLLPLLGCASNRVVLREDLNRAALERDPEKLRKTGESWAALGEPGRAAQYFELAIDNGADEARVFPRRLEMLVRDKQYRAASLAAENHLRKHPADVSLRFVAGTLHASLGDAVSARRDFEEVIAREPSNADDKGDLVAADEHFRQYLKLSPDGAHAEEARGLLLSSVR
jgi:tetratricopeptide (TPR) repeat protein